MCQKWPDITAELCPITAGALWSWCFTVQVLWQLFRLLTTQTDNDTQKSESLIFKALICNLLYKASPVSGEKQISKLRISECRLVIPIWLTKQTRLFKDTKLKISGSISYPENMDGARCAGALGKNHPQAPPLGALWSAWQGSLRQRRAGPFQAEWHQRHTPAAGGSSVRRTRFKPVSRKKRRETWLM